MAENSYSGYVKRPTPINWGEVASGVVNRMEDTEKKQEAFRTKYDSLAGELRKEVDKFVETSGLNPELDKKVSEATQMAKGLIFDMHNKLKRREINPSAMNNLQHSISSEWSDFNTVVKNIDQALVAAMDGVNDGENGKGTLYAVEKYGELMDLKYQNIVFDVDESGFAGLYMQKLDKNGNPVGNGLTSVRTLKNPNNLIFRNVKLDDRVEDFKDTIGIDKITDKYGNLIVDATKKEGYDDAVNDFVDDLLSDEKQVLSILADYGGYKIYTDGETPPKGKSVAMKVGANGEFVPLVDDLKDEADKIIRDAIDLAMPSVYKAAQKPKPGSGGGKGSTSTQPKLVYEYSTGLSQGDSTYIDLLINDTNNDITDVEITQAGPRKGVTIIKADGKREFTEYKYSGGEIDHDATGRNLAKYFSNKSDITDQQDEYDKGRDDFGKVDPGGTTTRKRKPDITSITIKYDHPTVKNKKLAPANAIADSPEQFTEQVFKDLGVPGVKIVEINNADGSFKIEVEGKKFTIRKTKRKDTGGKIKDANYEDVKKDIQKVIDYYYGKLAMEQPQEQQMDLTQTGAKYNVA